MFISVSENKVRLNKGVLNGCKQFSAESFKAEPPRDCFSTIACTENIETKKKKKKTDTDCTVVLYCIYNDVDYEEVQIF